MLDIVVIEEIEANAFSTQLAHFFDPQKHFLAWHPNDGEPSIDHDPADLSRIPGIHHLQARGITIMTGTDPQDVTLDGEVRGQTPAHVCLANERLRVMVPR